jgi:hypothetical protein
MSTSKVRRHYTQEEIEEIRKIFTSQDAVGLIDKIIEKYRSTAALRSFDYLVAYFLHAKMENISKVITLVEEFGIDGSFGSASIDFLGVVDGPFSIANALSLQSLRIGSTKNNLTPQMWFSIFIKGFDELSLLQKNALDEVFGDFVQLLDFAQHTPLELD